MLKIKDDVNLKSLEMFRFKHKPVLKNCYERYDFKIKDQKYNDILLCCCVWCHDRTISIHSAKGLDVLFDLIQAGLVEKVEQ